MVRIANHYTTGAALASVNLTEVANSVPAEERFLIFDILGKVNSKSVVEAFKNLDVVYKFKVSVLARNSQDDLDTLYDLDIPDADDIKVYPAEHYGSYAKYFYDKEVEDEQMVHLPNANLLLVEFTILADGMSKQQYKDAFKKIVKEYMELANTTPVYEEHGVYKELA
nr:hypothetical protein BaRGS_017150 [Batillaria attramentaria]